MTTKPSPLDMPRMTPWWTCRVSGSNADTYAIKGYRGLFHRDGRRFVRRSGRNS